MKICYFPAGLVLEETQDGFFQDAAGAGKSGFNRVAEGFAQFRGACADGEKHSVRRHGTIERVREAEELGRIDMVGSEVRGFGGAVIQAQCDGCQADASGRGFGRGIDKKHGIGISDILREVGSPLLASENANVGVVPESIRSPFSKSGSNAIVTA